MSAEKNHDLSQLEPKQLWVDFQKLCEIPRPSKHEEKVSKFLKEFGEKLNLETIQDDAGNVLIRKPATTGMENRQIVLLQAHIDMVPQKNNDTQHDFTKDPIEAYIDGEWVTANGTTLGADNGIGVAAMMAILEANDIPHGPLEALFTVDEETGMTGTFALKEDLLKADVLLNLDTEEWGKYYIGCAGGVNTDMELSYTTDKVPTDHVALKVVVKGLQGGHSGLNINDGRANAIKVLTRLLWAADREVDFSLADIDCGSALHNAIPREAQVIITLPGNEKDKFSKIINELLELIKVEYKKHDSGLMLEVTDIELPEAVMQSEIKTKLLNALYGCPNGVMGMSEDIPDLVETSTNLAHVKSENGVITVYTLQRGSVDSKKNDVANMVYSIFALTGGKVACLDPYPGWDPNIDSPILKLMSKVYKELFGEEVIAAAVHAGLECGLIGHKYPKMDMISIGPEITGAHSPDERAQIKTVETFWKLLLETLKQIPAKG